jgi:hypothetical protein
MGRDENDEGELLSSDLPMGPAGGSRATGSQVGQRRLNRRDEACDPLSAQLLASRAGLAPTRDDQERKPAPFPWSFYSKTSKQASLITCGFLDTPRFCVCGCRWLH